MPPLVVLAGGLGTRLRPVTGESPKVLAPVVSGVPMLRHVLEHWQERGAWRAVVCLGYKADAVERELAGWNLPLEIAISREDRPLGTGGALRQAARLLPDLFFVVNGDTIIDLELAALARWRQAGSWEGALIVRNAGTGGRVAVDGRGAITAFLGRGDATGAWIIAGVSLLCKHLVMRLPENAVADLEQDVLHPALADGSRLGGLRTTRPFHDLGTPERLVAYGDASRSTSHRGGRGR